MAEKIFSYEKYAAKAREAAGEGIVLLRNEGGVLPLPAGSSLALFGRSQFNYYKSGTGSGGLVNAAYVTGIREALEQSGEFELNGYVKSYYEEWLKDHPFDTGNGWAQEPWFQEEMPLTDEMVKKASEQSDTAVIVIGRTAGEDQDNEAKEGSYFLTKAEEQMLETVCGVFSRTVVLLNVGNIIDMKWVETYKPSAVLYVWQGGQEGGNGVLDVLSGKVSPSGRLADTIARDIKDYPSTEHYGDPKRNFYVEDIYVGYRYFSTFAPEKVLYPFGYGLSYTSFELTVVLEDLTDFAEPENYNYAESGNFMESEDIEEPGNFTKPENFPEPENFTEPKNFVKSGNFKEPADFTGSARLTEPIDFMECTDNTDLSFVFYAGNFLKNKNDIKFRVQVKNTGDHSGKEVVQVYCQAPQGVLGKPVRSLCGFCKTKCLAPEEVQELTINVPWAYLASYDDSGAAGNKSCYVLEPGDYIFYVGENVKDAKEAGRLNLASQIVTRKLEEALAPVTAFSHMHPGEIKNDGAYTIRWKEASLRTVSPAARRIDRLPEEYPYTGDKGYRLADVATDKVTMGEFLAQLTDEELCCAVRGEGMCSPKVTPGTAGAFGGVTKRLQEYGLPVGCCADGPSGIRMDCGTHAFAMPNGICLACTFNQELVQELYEWEGMELRKNQVDTLLGPGINIHRNPLNGRNFEYFSEDPLLTGKMAAAQLKGMHKYGVTGTIKHFACNNQEHERHFAEAVVSERALREIYLRGYEIAVKEGDARSIMTMYGPINGLWAASNYDLLTTVLRGEWGYRGMVMTDWWARGNDEGQSGTSQNTAAMVRSQNDLFMVTADAQSNSNDDNSEECLKNGTVTRGEFQRSVANICRFLMQSPAWLRKQGVETELDKELRLLAEQENASTGAVLKVVVDGKAQVNPALINTEKGKNTTMQVTVKERGLYRIEFTCRASAESPEMAQLPVSVFRDKKLVKTVTLTGAEKEWTRQIVELEDPAFNTTIYLKLFFGQGGMEIKDFNIVMTESLEEQLKQDRLKREEIDEI